jgi:hypothetical protein
VLRADPLPPSRGTKLGLVLAGCVLKTDRVELQRRLGASGLDHSMFDGPGFSLGATDGDQRL